MSQSQLSFGAKSIPASQQKPEFSQSRAWNFTQLYNNRDTSRSFIQKLPGDQTFMGNHVQLVCLLQAAQIQRLCKNLQEFKSRYKEIGKGTLDRHSYEIQIKELSQIIQSVKSENRKLKQFAMKQQRQLSQYNRSSDPQGIRVIQAKYQRALFQIEKMLKDNNQLQQSINSLVRQNQKLKIEQRGNSQMYKIKLKRIKQQFEQQAESPSPRKINMLEDQIQAKKSKIQSLTQTIQFYQIRSEKITKDMQAMNHLAQQKDHQTKQLKIKLEQYQNKIALLSQEIERLIYVLKQNQKQTRNLHKQVEDKQVKINQNQSYIKQLEKIVRIEQDAASQRKKHKQQMEYNIRQMNIKIQELQLQNRRKTAMIDEKHKNMNALGASISESSTSFKLLSKEKDKLFQSLQEAQEQISIVFKEKQTLKDLISQRQTKIKQLFTALQHSNQQKTQILLENRILRDKVSSFTQSQQGLKIQQKQLIQHASNQIYQLQQKFSQTQLQNQQIKQLYNQISSKAQQAINQNMKLLKIIDQKDTDLLRLRKKIQTLAQTRQSNNKNIVFESILKQTQKTYRQLCDKNSQCKQLINEVKKVNLINCSLETQVKQIKESLIKIIKQQRDMRQKAQNQVKNQQGNSLEVLFNRIMNQISNIKSMHEHKIAKQNKFQSQVASQLKKLTNESKAIKRESAVKDIKQIERLNQLLVEKQMKLISLSNQVLSKRDTSENDLLSKQLTQKIIQITKQNVEIKRKLETICSQYERIVEKYENQKCQLKLIISELSIKDKQLQNMNKALRQTKQKLEMQSNQHSQIEFYKSKQEQLGRQLIMYQMELRSLTQQKQETRRTGQQLYSIRSNLQSQLQHRNQEIKSLSSKVSYLQHDRSQSQRAFEDYQRQIQQAKHQIIYLHNSLEQQKRDLQKINQEKQRLKLNLQNNLKEQIQTCRQIQKIEEKTSKLEQTSQQLVQLDKENRNLLNIIRNKNVEIKRNQVSNRKLQDQISYLKSFKKVMSKQIQRLNNETASLYSKIRQLRQQIEQRSRFSLQIVQTLQTMNKKIFQMQSQLVDINIYRNRILELEQQKQQYVSKNRELQIQRMSLSQQSVKFVNTIKIHEQKLMLLTQQFGQMEDIIYRLKKQNALLKSQNYDINIENEKSKGLQNKIKILSDEIDRVQHEKVDLYEQVTTCKFSMAQQMDSTKRINEQLSVIMLLSVQIQSLRSMVQSNEKTIAELRQHLVDPNVALKPKST